MNIKQCESFKRLPAQAKSNTLGWIKRHFANVNVEITAVRVNKLRPIEQVTMPGIWLPGPHIEFLRAYIKNPKLDVKKTWYYEAAVPRMERIHEFIRLFASMQQSLQSDAMVVIIELPAGLSARFRPYIRNLEFTHFYMRIDGSHRTACAHLLGQRLPTAIVSLHITHNDVCQLVSKPQVGDGGVI